MRFSEAKGRKVVSTATAQTVGTVHAFVVDPSTRAVRALQLKKTEDGDTLNWEDIAGFGTDAIMVDGPQRITAAADDVAALSGKEHHVLGKKVLSSVGVDLGSVVDVEFDEATGEVTGLVLDDGDVLRAPMVGVGPYAVVVRAT
jgi:uncharacterized protein YrrD